MFSFHLVQSSIRQRFQKQIEYLILVYDDDVNISERQHSRNIHEYILQFFHNLKHLSVTGLYSCLSFLHLSSMTFSSTTLEKLSIKVKYFEDCLALLDGRLVQLNTFIVLISTTDYDSSIVYNMVSLDVIGRSFQVEKE